MNRVRGSPARLCCVLTSEQLTGWPRRQRKQYLPVLERKNDRKKRSVSAGAEEKLGHRDAYNSKCPFSGNSQKKVPDWIYQSVLKLLSESSEPVSSFTIPSQKWAAVTHCVSFPIFPFFPADRQLFIAFLCVCDVSI